MSLFNKKCWPDHFVTYMYKPLDNKQKKYYAFRFPGATMGHIEVDDQMIIKDIEFYEDSCYETKYSGENSKGKVINWG